MAHDGTLILVPNLQSALRNSVLEFGSAIEGHGYNLNSLEENLQKAPPGQQRAACRDALAYAKLASGMHVALVQTLRTLQFEWTTGLEVAIRCTDQRPCIISIPNKIALYWTDDASSVAVTSVSLARALSTP